MRISIIAAVDRNRAIGLRNQLLFRLPADLKRFKALTIGHTVVMGRKTFESLPKGALPERRNVVVSATEKSLPGCDVYSSLEEALASSSGEVYIIGGASIYAQAMPLAERLCLTEVDAEAPEADCFFPPYSDGWRETARERHDADERHAHAFAFVDYARSQEP